MDDTSAFLLLFVMFVGWIFGSILCGNTASIKGLNAASWFFAALICSPLLALIALAGVPCAPGYPIPSGQRAPKSERQPLKWEYAKDVREREAAAEGQRTPEDIAR